MSRSESDRTGKNGGTFVPPETFTPRSRITRPSRSRKCLPSIRKSGLSADCGVVNRADDKAEATGGTSPWQTFPKAANPIAASPSLIQGVTRFLSSLRVRHVLENRRASASIGATRTIRIFRTSHGFGPEARSSTLVTGEVDSHARREIGRTSGSLQSRLPLADNSISDIGVQVRWIA